MKKEIRILSIVMIAILLFTVTPVGDSGAVQWLLYRAGAAESLTCGDYEYTVTDGKAKVKKYTGSDEIVNIPGVLGDYPVTAIGENAFYYNTDIVEAVIPEGVVTLEYNAFAACFNLETVSLPESIEVIRENTFYYCTSLEKINYTGTEEQWIEINICEGNDGLAECEINFVPKAPAEETTTQVTTTAEEETTTAEEETTTAEEETTTAEEETTTEEISSSIESTTAVSEEATSETSEETSAEQPADETTAVSSQEDTTDYDNESTDIPETDDTEPVLPAKVSGVVLMATGSDGMTVYWGTVENADGYEVDYTKSRQFLLGETCFINDPEVTGCVISGLSEGDKYYVRIRAFIYVNGKKLYGAFSDTESVKIGEEPAEVTDEDATVTITVAVDTSTSTESSDTTVTVPAATTITTTAEKTDVEATVKGTKPAKVKIKKPVSKKKKQIVVTWSKVKDANGYQVSYSTSKKFTKKSTKTKLIKKAKTTKTTLKKLKGGKKYFVKVRAYKTVSKKKVYGAYSKVISVKVK